MNSRRYLGLVAAAATMLATAPLSVIFVRWTWLIQCLVVVALISATAALARSLRAPAWVQCLAMSGTLLLVLTWLYPSDGEFLALVPTPDTIGSFGGLLAQAGEDMRSYGVPVPDRRGLLFLTVLGVGGVAIVVDLVTVSLRRPALAGLPMLAIYSVPVAIYTDDVPAWPFVIGAAGFLWLLVADNVERVRRFGRRFSGDGRGIDAWEPSPLAAAGRRLAVVGVVAAVALPLAVPDLGDGLVSTMGAGSGDGPGNGSRKGAGAVDLFAELSGRLNQSETQELLKVTTNEPVPYYLRFAVADQVSRTGFRNRPPDGRSVPRALSDPREDAVTGVTYRKYHAKIEISKRFDMPMLPVYAEPIATDGIDSAWLYDDDARIVYSNRARSGGRSYEIDYVRARYDPAALRRAPSLPAGSDTRKAFTSVPMVGTVVDRVNRLTKGETNDYDKVRAIYDSFSAENGFAYSLATKPGTSGNDIVDFLENKTGFCEQYAAAMAWMVRTAGIPARVAFGFTNGNARDGRTYTLTNRNLHAWTEVYFPSFGWVPFDATPAASVPGSVVSAWAPDTNRPEEEDPTTDPSAAPATGASAGPTARADDALADDPDAFGGSAPAGNPVTRWSWWLPGVLILLLVLVAPAVRRVMLRRSRRTAAPAPTPVDPAGSGPDPRPGAPVVTVARDADLARADAHAAWAELLDTMVDFRVPVDPTETPRATAERLVGHAELADASADATRLLGRAEERARYARDPLTASGLGTALGSVRQALAERATRWERTTAVLLPPSVLLRWRMWTGDLTTRVILIGARWRNRLTPRRLTPRRSGPATR